MGYRAGVGRLSPRRPRRPAPPFERPRLPLGPQQAHVGVEIDLDRVAWRGHVALAHLALLTRDLRPHLRSRGQRGAALEQVRDPLGLELRHRHDRPERLHQADEVEPGRSGGTTRR